MSLKGYFARQAGYGMLQISERSWSKNGMAEEKNIAG